MIENNPNGIHKPFNDAELPSLHRILDQIYHHKISDSLISAMRLIDDMHIYTDKNSVNMSAMHSWLDSLCKFTINTKGEFERLYILKQFLDYNKKNYNITYTFLNHILIEVVHKVRRNFMVRDKFEVEIIKKNDWGSYCVYCDSYALKNIFFLTISELADFQGRRCDTVYMSVHKYDQDYFINRFGEELIPYNLISANGLIVIFSNQNPTKYFDDSFFPGVIYQDSDIDKMSIDIYIASRILTFLGCNIQCYSADKYIEFVIFIPQELLKDKS